jgi:adenosylcobinamide kinase/adenosylcobinamide-phosphate guanylyltransferase
MTSRRVLVLGGARSGKSRHAEDVVSASGLKRIYIATAETRDGEMVERVRLHQVRRGEGWRTVEEPLALVDCLMREASPAHAILVDCLTLWISNLMFAEADVEAAVAELAAALPSLQGTVCLVSNEVGLGIVPDNALARRFRDFAGLANQRLAAVCDEVVFVAAGLPLRLR